VGERRKTGNSFSSTAALATLRKYVSLLLPILDRPQICGQKVQKAFNEVYRSFNVNQSPFIVADFILPTGVSILILASELAQS
jgi:hypothetical protein